MIRQATFIVLASLLTFGTTNATNELDRARAPAVGNNPHLSWQEFRLEIASYPQVTAGMTGDGVVTLSGHVDGGDERVRVEALARKVEGATAVKSLILSD